jgi:hypothetical protein
LDKGDQHTRLEGADNQAVSGISAVLAWHGVALGDHEGGGTRAVEFFAYKLTKGGSVDQREIEIDEEEVDFVVFKFEFGFFAVDGLQEVVALLFKEEARLVEKLCVLIGNKDGMHDNLLRRGLLCRVKPVDTQDDRKRVWAWSFMFSVV